jgi:hypothetical protein
MSLTPPTSSVIDIADHKIGDFNVEFLGEYEFLFKKAVDQCPRRGLNKKNQFWSKIS